MDELKGYLTTVEAARRLGVSRARVDQFCRAGRLQFVRVGNARLITEASVTEFEKLDRPAHRPKGTEPAPKPKPKRK